MIRVLHILLTTSIFYLLLNSHSVMVQTEATTNPCPNDWKYFAGSNSCFQASPTPVYYLQAQLRCVEENGQLASFSNKEEFDFLVKLINEPKKVPKEPFWIGLVHGEDARQGTNFGDKSRFRLLFVDSSPTDFLDDQEQYDHYWGDSGRKIWEPTGGSNKDVKQCVALNTKNGKPGYTNRLEDLKESNKQGYICKRCAEQPTPIHPQLATSEQQPIAAKSQELAADRAQPVEPVLAEQIPQQHYYNYFNGMQ